MGGDPQELRTRPDSRCFFVDRFDHAGLEVGLRFDWGDQDADGNPTLDADFYLPGSKKPKGTVMDGAGVELGQPVARGMSHLLQKHLETIGWLQSNLRAMSLLVLSRIRLLDHH